MLFTVSPSVLSDEITPKDREESSKHKVAQGAAASRIIPRVKLLWASVREDLLFSDCTLR
jgi:hypothetical protein